MSVGTTGKIPSQGNPMSQPPLQVVWYARIWAFLPDKDLHNAILVSRNFISLLPIFKMRKSLESAFYHQKMVCEFLQRAKEAELEGRFTPLYTEHVLSSWTSQLPLPDYMLDNPQRTSYRFGDFVPPIHTCHDYRGLMSKTDEAALNALSCIGRSIEGTGVRIAPKKSEKSPPSSDEEDDISEEEQIPTGNRTALHNTYRPSPTHSSCENKRPPSTEDTLATAGVRYHFTEGPPPPKISPKEQAKKTPAKKPLAFHSSAAAPPYKIPVPLPATDDRFTCSSFPTAPRDLTPPSDPSSKEEIQTSQDIPGDGSQAGIAFEYGQTVAATSPTSAPRPPDTGDTTSSRGTENEDDTF